MTEIPSDFERNLVGTLCIKLKFFLSFSISIVRLPGSINDNVDEDPTGTKSLWDRGLLNGASQKADCICVIHIGEIPLSLQKGKISLLLYFLENINLSNFSKLLQIGIS